MEPIVLVAVCDIPHLKVRAGERVSFDPAVSPLPRRRRGPFWVDIPNPGAVLGAFTDGALRPLTPVSPRILAALAG